MSLRTLQKNIYAVECEEYFQTFRRNNYVAGGGGISLGAFTDRTCAG